MTKPFETECFALLTPTNELYLTGFSEAECWRHGLGWPDEQEIEAAKKRGCRVIKVRIQEIE